MVTKFTEFSLRFDRKNQIEPNDSTSTGLIEIRMYFDGKASYKSTGYRITHDQWNKKKNVPKDALMLRNIHTFISEYQTFESEFRAINKKIPNIPYEVNCKNHVHELVENFCTMITDLYLRYIYFTHAKEFLLTIIIFVLAFIIL